MKRVGVLVLGLFHAAALMAAAAPASSSEQEALRELVQTYERAIRSGEVSKSGIRTRLTKGFSAALPSGQLVSGYTELNKAENALRTMVGRGARYQTVEVTVDPSIEVSGELAALSGRTFSQASAQAGKTLAFTTYWSAVARKEEGVWRLLRHQAVMDPATNPWQVEETSGPGWSWVLAAGFLGALGGGIAGWAAARLLGARPRAAAQPMAVDTPAPATTRPRAWDKDHPPASERNASGPAATTENVKPRSWQTTPTPSSQPVETDSAPAAPATPATPAALEPPATEEPAPPSPSRGGKKRAWEA